ncbi:hypothetical protein SUGI_1090340 [Cryptomeria japonica]|nr:hypothetical protein SUGI_1090340 [Cryptomeria japonica]
MDTEEAIKYLVLAITMIIAAHNCSSLPSDGGHTLLLGASLTGNQTILSKNGTFALGFFSPRGTNNWYIGIWYAGKTQKIIVWVANRENPVRSMPGGVLHFSRDGQLRLLDRKARSVWSTDIHLKGSRAVLRDSGNFIMLGDGHNKSEIVWESFAHPTDTWLPGMKMWKGMHLTSWKSSVDPAASGLFSYGMDMSPRKTQMVLVYNNSIPYSSSGEWTGNYFTKIPEIGAEKRFRLFCVRISPESIYFNFSINQVDHTLNGRIILSENGMLELYYLMDDNRWTIEWSTFGGQWSDYDICGAYGVCNKNEVCSCSEGFAPKHASASWWSNGCARRRPLQCSVTEGTTDDFLEAKNQYLPEKEAVSYNNKATLEDCRIACLKNCSCTAFACAISDPPVCRLWFGDLFKIRVSSDGQSVFIRLAASEFPHLTSERGNKAPALRVLLPAAAAAFFAVLGLLSAIFIVYKRRKLQMKRKEEDVPTSLKIERGNILGVVDARIASEADIEEVKRAVVVAGQCIQDDEDERPSMSEVVKILQGTMEAPPPQITRSLQLLVV